MSAILQAIIAFFSGSAGRAIGSTVANGTAVASLVALVPVFLANKDELAVTLTWGQAGFLFALLAVVVKVAHWTRAPGG